MGPAGSTLSTAMAGVHPGCEALGTAHLDEVKSRSPEPELLGWTLPPLTGQSAQPNCLSFLICKLGIVMVTTSRDGYEGKFSENIQDVEQYLTHRK